MERFFAAYINSESRESKECLTLTLNVIYAKPPMKHINLNLSDELHTKFKTACASQGKKMTEVLQAAVDKYLEDFAVKVEKKKSRN